MKPILPRERRVAVEVHHAVLAERRRARASSRAATRARRRRGSRGSRGGSGRSSGSRPRPPAGHSSSASGASSSISWVMRTPRSTVGSYSKASCGVRFSRSSRATRACRTPCAASRPSSVFARLRLRAEHADEDTCVPQVRRGLDPGDGDEPDPRVLQLAHRLGDDLADGFVDSAHPVSHSGYSSGFGQLGARSRRRSRQWR